MSKYIKKAPIRRLMKREGADLVSEDAVLKLIEVIEERAVSIVKEAKEIVKYENRKRITEDDIRFVVPSI